MAIGADAGLGVRILATEKPRALEQRAAVPREVLVLYQLCAVLLRAEHELAVVELLELGAMSDAHDRGRIELLGDEAHEHLLARWIKCGCRLVHDDEIGFGE